MIPGLRAPSVRGALALHRAAPPGGGVPPGGADDLTASLVLVALGLLALGLGLLWATDFRAVVTRRYARQLADRARLPSFLRKVSPPPPRPGTQRLTGALLAATGGVFAVSGVCRLFS